MKQETHGRFTPGAWNFIKQIELDGEQADKFHLMIEGRTETITLEEAKSILYTIVKGSENK